MIQTTLKGIIKGAYFDYYNSYVSDHGELILVFHNNSDITTAYYFDQKINNYEKVWEISGSEYSRENTEDIIWKDAENKLIIFKVSKGNRFIIYNFNILSKKFALINNFTSNYLMYYKLGLIIKSLQDKKLEVLNLLQTQIISKSFSNVLSYRFSEINGFDILKIQYSNLQQELYKIPILQEYTLIRKQERFQVRTLNLFIMSENKQSIIRISQLQQKDGTIQMFKANYGQMWLIKSETIYFQERKVILHYPKQKILRCINSQYYQWVQRPRYIYCEIQQPVWEDIINYDYFICDILTSKSLRLLDKYQIQFNQKYNMIIENVKDNHQLRIYDFKII